MCRASCRGARDPSLDGRFERLAAAAAGRQSQPGVFPSIPHFLFGTSCRTNRLQTRTRGAHRASRVNETRSQATKPPTPPRRTRPSPQSSQALRAHSRSKAPFEKNDEDASARSAAISARRGMSSAMALPPARAHTARRAACRDDARRPRRAVRRAIAAPRAPAQLSRSRRSSRRGFGQSRAMCPSSPQL